jgi:hypothetical protein
MPEEKQRLRGLQAARLVLSVSFCIGLALFIWLQVGTYNLANRLTAIGYIANGNNLRQVVVGESALVVVCTVALLSLRRTWFTRVGILTIFN